MINKIINEVPKTPLYIGTGVLVKKICTFEVNEKNKREISFKEQNRWGQIVGATYKHTGLINSLYDGGSYYDPPEYCGNYLQTESVYFVYIVRFGLMNRECYVLPDNILATRSDFTVPKKDRNSSAEKSESYRSEMREIMKEWPRDSKGRWLKTT